MKAANKAVKAAVTLVREPSAIDQLFERSSLGYLIAPSSKKEDASNLTIEDSVNYVISKLESGQSAMREAILLCGFIFKTKTAEQSKAFEDSLKSRWNGSTIPNLVSISKALPSFEEKGLNLTKVKDLYGIRDCAKLLKSEEHGKAAIALLNEGAAPRAVKQKLEPKEKPAQESPTVPLAINIGEESDKLETLILSYVERYAKLAEHESRLKLTRQIIAKMSIGAYTFLPAAAAQAVESLKAKK